MTQSKYVDADPYKWPFNGDLKPSNTCIIVIGEYGIMLCPFAQSVSD